MAAVLVLFAGCSESGTSDSEPLSPQLGHGPPHGGGPPGGGGGVDCTTDPPLSGTSPLTVNVQDGTTGMPLASGFVAVFVHPDCGPIRFGQDGGTGDDDGIATPNGTVVFADLSPVSGFVHVRDGVTLAASELDIAPPPLGVSNLDLGLVPAHAATMTGERGASLPVTVDNYLAALDDPPVRIRNNGSDVTIVMPTQEPIEVRLFNLDLPGTLLPVSALLRFGAAAACGEIPWIASDDARLHLCESGGGIAYATGIDIKSGTEPALVMGDPDDPDCVIEVIGTGDVSGELVAASAPCEDADEQNVLRLFPRPALCVLPPASGAGFIADERGNAKAIDYLNATFGALALHYPGVPGTDAPQVPDPTKVAVYGDFTLLAPTAVGQFKSKETLATGASSENLSFTVEQQADGDVVCRFPDNPGNAAIFCVSENGVDVKYAVIQRDLSPSRLEFSFTLNEQGGDAIPDPDQAGGESSQVVPAPPASCNYEFDGTRFSIKF